jgi:hypothetical protein
MLKLPAAPDAGCCRKKFWYSKSPEVVTMALGKPSLVVPTISTDSEAVTVTFPPDPAPRVEALIDPPSRRINRLAFNLTSPPLPLPSVPAMITLVREGMEPVEVPITSTESEALTVMFPPGPPVISLPPSSAPLEE